MISCIIGLPGSGKSTLLSYIGYRACEGKKVNFHGFHISTAKYQRVFTNFPCSGAFKLDFELLGKADYRNCLILCDEIQLFADSRNFKSFSDDLKFWFSVHRKLGVDFIYATQSFDAVDKRIRSLTDRIYYVDKWSFNMIRCREILTYFSTSDLSQKFELASGFNTAYFYAPRLYKYNDTFNLIKDVSFEPVPLNPWKEVPASDVGTFLTLDGDFATVKDSGAVEVTKMNVETCKK